MTIIGCDFPSRARQINMPDTETGEVMEMPGAAKAAGEVFVVAPGFSPAFVSCLRAAPFRSATTAELPQDG